MIVEGSDNFHCPSGDFTASTAKRIFNHMALKCCDVKIYLALKNTHDAAAKEFDCKPKFPVSDDIITSNKVGHLSTLILDLIEHPLLARHCFRNRSRALVH